MWNPFTRLKNAAIKKGTEKAVAPVAEQIGEFVAEQKARPLKGWTTVLVNGGILCAAAFLEFLAHIDLEHDLGLTPTAATIGLTVINIILRAMTTTAVGKSSPTPPPPDQANRGSALTGVFILALMLGASQARAQTDFVPQYFTLGGVSYDYYGGSGFAGVTVFGAKLTPTSEGKPGFPVYSITTIELTKDIATARTGLSYVFFQDGNWALAGLGDAGATTGSGQTLGSFSGGGSISFDIGGKLTGNKSHFFISPAVRVLNITGKTVQPIYEIMFGPGFGR